MSEVEKTPPPGPVVGRTVIDQGDVLALVLMSLISFVIQNTIGLFLLPLVSIPLVGGFISGWVDAIVIFLAIYIVPRRGACLLFAMLILTLSTVTPSFGPPGWYKILIGLMLGGAMELTRELVGRATALGNIAAVVVAFALSVPCTYLAWNWFGPPGADLVLGAIAWMPAVYAVIGLVGSWLGLKVYHTRLEKVGAVRAIRAGLPRATQG